MKLNFKVTQDFYDTVEKRERKAGDKFTADHLDKRVWELVRAKVAEQVEDKNGI